MASLALAVICDLADMCGVTNTGKIRKFDDGLSNEQPASWYGRNDFDVRGDCIRRAGREASGESYMLYNVMKELRVRRRRHSNRILKGIGKIGDFLSGCGYTSPSPCITGPLSSRTE